MVGGMNQDLPRPYPWIPVSRVHEDRLRGYDVAMTNQVGTGSVLIRGIESIGGFDYAESSHPGLETAMSNALVANLNCASWQTGQTRHLY